MEFIYISLLVLILTCFYAIGMYFNRKTPLPEDCDIPSLKCDSCSSITCGYSEVNRAQTLKEEIKASLKNNIKEGANNE